jgi:hypothetical protein
LLHQKGDGLCLHPLLAGTATDHQRQGRRLAIHHHKTSPGILPG